VYLLTSTVDIEFQFTQKIVVANKERMNNVNRKNSSLESQQNPLSFVIIRIFVISCTMNLALFICIKRDRKGKRKLVHTS